MTAPATALMLRRRTGEASPALMIEATSGEPAQSGLHHSRRLDLRPPVAPGWQLDLTASGAGRLLDPGGEPVLEALPRLPVGWMRAVARNRRVVVVVARTQLVGDRILDLAAVERAAQTHGVHLGAVAAVSS